MTQAASLLVNASRDLARCAAGSRFNDIPPAVIDHAKLCVQDGLGVGLFGAKLEAMAPAFRRACRLDVTTKDGRTIRNERLARRGSPEDAVGSTDIVRKFEANVDGILSAEVGRTLLGVVMQLDKLADPSDLTKRLVVQV